MKPPRSVWVVLAPTHGPVDVFPFRYRPDAITIGSERTTVVRYDLHRPKRKPRKGRMVAK